MLKQVTLGSKTVPVPIIQGGMGIGISMANLASAVMKEGGIGVISAAMPGFDEPDFATDPVQANIRALKREIQHAKQTPGILGVNVMVAAQHYDLYVNTAIEAGADLIISGAGLPLQLPEYVNGRCMMAPIVSSAKAAKVILSMWDRHHHVIPDAIIMEGHEAGGHLGFKKEDLQNHTCQSNEAILKEVLDVVKPFETKYNKHIPLFVAGGIYSHEDIIHFMNLGADGVQMATRFIATKECDAATGFKEMIVHAKREDIVLVKSPAGMPGRAIRNSFVRQMENGEPQTITKCYGCMVPCNPASTPYCITRALIHAAKGDTENGLFFTSTSAARIDHISDVHSLMKELIGE